MKGLLLVVCYVITMTSALPLIIYDMSEVDAEILHRQKRQNHVTRNPDGSYTAAFGSSQSFGNARPGSNVAGTFGFSETVTFGGRPGSSHFSESGSNNFGLSGNIGPQSFGNSNSNSHSSAQGQGPTGFGAANANSVGNSNFNDGPNGGFSNSNAFNNANANVYNRPRPNRPNQYYDRRG